MDLLSEFGTRHRAAFGLAERCDAAVIVVSEERGVVTLVHGHHQQVLASIEDLAQALQSLGVAKGSSPVRGLRRNLSFKVAALAVAGLLWVASFEAPGATVRNITVPIEFTNVPAGMEVHLSPESATLQVQLRGTSWLFETVSLDRMAARVDLKGSPTGQITVPLSPALLQAPLGIRVESVSPAMIQVELVHH
jgi:hypothetical protein